MIKLFQKILCCSYLTIVLLTIPFPYLHAELSIGNGKLFICENQQIISVKDSTIIELNKALRRFNKIIIRANEKLSTTKVGTPQFNKARLAKKIAIQGRKDLSSCQQGELKSVVGSWNLITENGSTPDELGFESLMIEFLIKTFKSRFTGTTLTCDWTGSYTKPSNDSLALTTRTGVGGTTCEEAIGQSRGASFILSDDGNMLTLDYRPNGTLQVFERVR